MNEAQILSVPSAPQNVTAVRTDVRSLTISWNAPSSTNGTIIKYAIQLSKDNGVTWYFIPTPLGSATTHIANIGFGPGQIWKVRVSATNNSGQGPYSDASNVNAVWLPDPPLVGASTSGQNVIVSWSPGPDNYSPITGYIIYISTTPPRPGEAPIFTPIAETTNTTFTFDMNLYNISQFRSYAFGVAAINNKGVSSIGSSPRIVIVPRLLAPGNLSVQLSDNHVLLSWSQTSSDRISGYTIDYSSDNGASWTNAGEADRRASRVFLRQLAGNASYIFKVAAISTSFETGFYATTTTPFYVPGPPKTPTNLSVVVGETDATVSWTHPQNEPSTILDYDVWYSQYYPVIRKWVKATPADLLSFDPGLSNGTSYIIPGLTFNTRYIFKVRARNSFGYGDFSEETQEYRMIKTVDKPSYVKAISERDGSITVSWSRPTRSYDGQQPQYHILYAEVNSTFSGVFYKTSDTPWVSYPNLVNGTSVNITGLTIGKTYQFKVRAVNSRGYGKFNDRPVSWGNKDTAICATFPSATRNLTGILTDRSIYLSWQPPLGNGGSPLNRYRIQMSTDNVNWNVIRKCGNTFCFSPNGIQDDPIFTYHIIPNLRQGIPYWFRVGAINNAGHRGTFSNKVGPFIVS